MSVVQEMAGVTIPATMHRAQVDKYQRKYETELDSFDRVQSYTHFDYYPL